MSRMTALMYGLLCVSSGIALEVQASNCCNTKWHLELEPFYAKVTDTLLSNAIFAVKTFDPAIFGDFKQLYHLDEENDWGGRIALGYDFYNCNNRGCGLSIEYTWLHQNNSNHIANNARTVAGLPVLAPAEFIDITDESSARFNTADSRLKQDYDTVDLLADKRWSFCNCYNYLRFFGGIRYFHLKEELHNHYEFNGDIESVTVHNLYRVNVDNEVNTAGPEVGASVFYHLAQGFGLTGQLATSLLYGESKSKFNNFHQLTPASVLGDVTQLTSTNHLDDTAHFIPSLSGKVGVAYQAEFCNGYSLKIEAGYRGDQYFHAANDVAYQQLLAGDDINSNCNYQNIYIAGPYLTLGVSG